MSKQDSDVVRTNVQVVRGVYDGWIDGDVTRALEYLDPGIVWEAITDAPDAGTYRGHAGVRRLLEDWLGDFDILGLDFEEIIDEGEWLVITQCARATGKGSGAKTEFHYAAAYRLEQGKIVEIREFRTKAEALETLGLSEQDAHADS
jgi:ketosteroid isomerase-like protein